MTDSELKALRGSCTQDKKMSAMIDDAYKLCYKVVTSTISIRKTAMFKADQVVRRGENGK